MYWTEENTESVCEGLGVKDGVMLGVNAWLRVIERLGV